jgi:hypothetical protein
MKAYEGGGGHTRQLMEKITNFMHGPLYLSQGKKPLYPLSRKLVEHQRWFARFRQENNLLPLPGIEPWLVQHVAWSSYRQLYLGSKLEVNERVNNKNLDTKVRDTCCTCNVPLRRLHVTVRAVEKQQCVLRDSELNVTANCNYKKLRVAQQFLWLIYVASNNKMYTGLHVKCPMLHGNKEIFICAWSSSNI